MSNLQTALINFQNTQLITAYDESTGKTYVAMKPLVVGMGLSWGEQSKKLKEDGRYSVICIPYITKGGTQEMVSLDADHLPAFLYSINPNRVRKDLRDRIIAFQTETFAVINDYWRRKTQIVIENTTDKEHLGALEQQLYMVKRENTELKRAINRLTYNSGASHPVVKHNNKSKKELLQRFSADGFNEYDIYLLLAKGIIPFITEHTQEIMDMIDKELGTVGHKYKAKLKEIQRLFNERPHRIGNGIMVGSVIFPDAKIYEK